MNLNKPNGGFPPINIVKKDIKKESNKAYKEDKLKIRNILNDSKIKPMIDLDENKTKINIIDNL